MAIIFFIFVFLLVTFAYYVLSPTRNAGVQTNITAAQPDLISERAQQLNIPSLPLPSSPFPFLPLEVGPLKFS